MAGEEGKGKRSLALEHEEGGDLAVGNLSFQLKEKLSIQDQEHHGGEEKPLIQNGKRRRVLPVGVMEEINYYIRIIKIDVESLLVSEDAAHKYSGGIEGVRMINEGIRAIEKARKETALNHLKNLLKKHRI